MFALNYILFRLVAIYKVGQKKRHLKNKIKVQNCICHVFRIQIVLLLIKKERKSICFPLSHTPLSIIVYYNEQHIQEDKCVHRKTFLHDLRKIQTHADMFCLEIL